MFAHAQGHTDAHTDFQQSWAMLMKLIMPKGCRCVEKRAAGHYAPKASVHQAWSLLIVTWQMTQQNKDTNAH